MSKRKALCLLIFQVLVGCAPVTTGAPTSPPSSGPRGRVVLAVRWPAPRQVQLLPISAQSVELEILTPEGISLAKASLARVPEQSAATLSMAVNAGDVRVVARAYDRDANGGSSLVAQATRALVIKPNFDNACALSLVPVYIPSLNAPNGFNAGAGGRLELLGANFGHTRQTPLQVLVGGVLAASAQRVSDTTIRLEVPGAATSGEIQVIADGVPSATASFQLLSQLTLQCPSTVQPAAVLTLGVAGQDEGGRPVPAPSVRWLVHSEAGVRGDELARITQDGVLTVGSATGTVMVAAVSGSVAATASIQIQ
ncbi:hypothetical protein D3C86_974970 [compost metagenome]